MRIPLTAFLVRKGVDPLGALLSSAAARVELSNWIEGRLVSIEFDPEAEERPHQGSVVVALSKRPSGVPPWQRLIEEMLGLPDFGGAGQSRGAIIFCSVEVEGSSDRRWVAWCFGSGSKLISRRATEPRFGLLAALNALVTPLAGNGGSSSRAPQLRNLEYRETTPYFQQTGHRAARDIPVDAFRIDRTSDLLSGAGGHTADPVLSDVHGSRSLKFRQSVTSIADLQYLSKIVFERASEERYKEKIGWADNIWPVDDPVVEDELREALLGMLLTSPLPPTLDALIPDDLVAYDDDRSIQYVAYPRERTDKASRITLTPEMLAELAKNSGTGAASSGALDVEMRFLDAGHEFIGSASILECLCVDMEVAGERFIAYDGSFFSVKHEFVESIDAELDRIPISAIGLPCYRGGREDAYIGDVGKELKDEFAVVHESYLSIPGESSVEPCDLVSKSGALIYLKRKGKSQMLSHLFTQVVSACSLLRRFPDARRQLETLVLDSGSEHSMTVAACEELKGLEPGTNGVEVVFAFLGSWRGRGARHLPLLSKIALVNAARRVDLLGQRPSLALVDLCSNVSTARE